MTKFEFTPIQKKYKEAIDWLIDDSLSTRRIGRSELLARCFIDKALRGPYKVEIFDHSPNYYCKERLADRIKQIITEEKLPLEFHQNDMCIQRSNLK